MGAGFIRAGCAVIARTSCKATTRHQVQGTNRERRDVGAAHQPQHGSCQTRNADSARAD